MYNARAKVDRKVAAGLVGRGISVPGHGRDHRAEEPDHRGSMRTP